MGKKLYRYISFEDFVNLVINGKDKFVRPSIWEDQFEGFMFSHMDSKADVRRVVEKLYHSICPKNHYAVSDNFFKLWHSKWFVYAQCWSKHCETDAMWRCYAYGNRSIRIRTTDEKLLKHAKNIFTEQEYFSVYLKAVSYDVKEKNAFETQMEQMKSSRLIHEAYFHKRNVFKHEGEYRLLISDNSNSGFEDLASDGVKFDLKEKIKGKNDNEIIDYLTEMVIKQRADWGRIANLNVRIEEAGDITAYLDGVMVHPLAPDWYCEIIKQICDERKLKYDGQSQIYKIKK